MFTFFNQSGENRKSLFEEARMIYKQQEAKEKKGEKVEGREEVKPEETFEARKAQARQEVESIYRNDKYAPYKLNELPPEFQAHLRNSFAEWVAANVDDYDKDKNSGINAAEYETFRAQLNEKVTGVLDRLVGAKEERRREAVAEKESAEAAKERQERLKYQDISRIDPGNLVAPETLVVADPVRGLVTELFKYREDWQREVQQFQMFAVGDFVQTMTKIQKAAEGGGRRGLDAIEAFRCNLSPWLEDTIEVKSAKEAREKAIADMQKRIEHMKKRQKDRQKRGETLNAAPEVWRKERQEVYDKARREMRKKQKEAQEARRKNAEAKQRAEKARKALEEKREEAQKSFDEFAFRAREFELHAQKAREELGAVAGAPQAPEGGVSPEAAEELAKKAEAAIDPRLLELRRQAATRQKHLLDLLTERSKIDEEISQRTNADSTLNSTIEKIQSAMETIDEAENKEMQAIDSVDEGIADTVLSVGVGNEQIIEQAQVYLRQLSETQVRGQGVIDAIGAGILGIPGYEKAWNWTKQTASNEWEFIKKDAVMGPIVSIIGYMGEGWVKTWDGIGAGFTWVGEVLHLPQAWEWMSHASEHLSIGTPLSSMLGWLGQSNLPSGFKTFLIHFAAAGDAIADTTYGGGVGTVIEVFAGVTEGGKDLIQGLGTIVQNPFMALGGIKEMINHPGMLVDAFIQRDKWGHESASKIIGRGIVEVWTTITGGTAVAKGLARVKYARNIEKLSRSKAALLGLQEGLTVWAQEWQQLLATLFRDIPVAIFKAPGSLLKTIGHGGKPAARAAEAAEAVFPLVRRKPQKPAKSVPPPPPSARRLKEPSPPPSARRVAAASREAVTGAEPVIIRRVARGEPIKPPPSVSEKLTPRVNRYPIVMSSQRRLLFERFEEKQSLSRKLHRSLEHLKVNGVDISSLLHRLPEYDFELLVRHADEMPAEIVHAVLRQEYYKIIDDSGQIVRVYQGRRLGNGTFGVVSDVFYDMGERGELASGAGKRMRALADLQRRIQETQQRIEEINMEKRTKRNAGELDARLKVQRQRLAELNFEYNNRRAVFSREVDGARAVRRFDNTDGLILPEVVSQSNAGELMVIYQKMENSSGLPVDYRDRLTSPETLEAKLGFLEDACRGASNLHRNGYVHMDFKLENIFVGEIGTARRGHLGDLSLIHWRELAHLEIKPVQLRSADGKTVTHYSLLKRAPGESMATSRQIGTTASYFSAKHIEKLISEARKRADEFDELGQPPPELLALAEKNQIGHSLSIIRDMLDINHIRRTISELELEISHTQAMDTATLEKLYGKVAEMKRAEAMAKKYRQRYGSTLDDAMADIDLLSRRLKDADDPVTIANTIAEIQEIRRRLSSVAREEARPAAAPV
jgi:hypothetical protein